MNVEQLKQVQAEVDAKFTELNSQHMDMLQELYKLQGEWRALQTMIEREEAPAKDSEEGEVVSE
jgi:hypothetical protein